MSFGGSSSITLRGKQQSHIKIWTSLSHIRISGTLEIIYFKVLKTETTLQYTFSGYLTAWLPVVKNSPLDRQTHLVFIQSSLIFVLITLWAIICLPPTWSQFYITLIFIIFNHHLHTLNICILCCNYLGTNFISLFLRFKSIIISWNHSTYSISKFTKLTNQIGGTNITSNFTNSAVLPATWIFM